MLATGPSQSAGISTVDALWVLIQSQSKAVRRALIQRLLSEGETTQIQKKIVKESLTQAFDELHAGMSKHDARNLFSE